MTDNDTPRGLPDRDPNPMAAGPTKWRAERCVTHHHGCDCREWEHAEKVGQLEADADDYREAMGDLVSRLQQAEAEADALRETNRRLNRRCQEAESAIPDYQRIVAMPPNGDGIRFVSGGLGRALLHSLCSKQQTELDSLRERLRAVEGALRTARDYVAAELEAERDKFRGFEHCSDIDGITADLAAIDAVQGRGE